MLNQVRRLEEVVDQLENWFALRNSVELDDLCLEVGWSGGKIFIVKVWRRLCSNSQLTFAGGSLEGAGACLAEEEENKSTSSSIS